MSSRYRNSGWRRTGGWLVGSIAALTVTLSLPILLSQGGCAPSLPDGNDNTSGGANDNESGEVLAEIVSFSQSFELSSLDSPLSVIYSVSGNPDSVRGVYVAVAGTTPDAGHIGDPVDLGIELATGVNQAFNFDPQMVGVGNYRVGVAVTVAGVTDLTWSAGVLIVQGPPDPVFIQPDPEVTTQVPAGDEVQVIFDVGDPENDVAWRLFYLTAADARTDPLDQLGTELATGLGNAGSFSFSTVGLPAGQYEFGISATDTGDSVSATVADGLSDRIVTIGIASAPGPIIEVVEEPDPILPTIALVAPGAADVELFLSEAFTIQFAATAGEPGVQGVVELFYDTDNIASNGFTLIAGATSLTPAVSSFPLPTDLPEGTYFIGASINDGLNPTEFAYAEGRIIVVRTPTLVVTAPDVSLPIAPSTPGGVVSSVPVTWTTNVPASAGQVDVFAQSVSASGTVIPGETSILAATTTTTTSTSFSSAVSGLFEVSVRITFDAEHGLAPLVVAAPQRVRISSLPAILWLGSLAEANPAFDGAVFGGVNTEDNAGSSFSPVGDLNGDGINEFMIGARYGKPFFTNDGGVGSGEAYLIYGSGSKLSGVHNLNSLGTAGLIGVTFTGIRTAQDSNDTDGMSSMGWVPDVDGDGIGELVFGFPNTDSRGHNIHPQQDGVVDPRALGTLEREEQFLRGGLVFVSSRNSILGFPEFGDPVINLDLVGQDFEVTCVDPEPDADDGAFYMDVHADTDADPPCEGTCGDPTTGGAPDATTIIDYGFVSPLARDYFNTFVYSVKFFGGVTFCADSAQQFITNGCLDLNSPVLNVFCEPLVDACEPFSPGLFNAVSEPITEMITDPVLGRTFEISDTPRHSGYYVHMIDIGETDPVRNLPLEPLGARVLGIGVGDAFGTSFTLSDQLGNGAVDIIASAPGRTARGTLFGPTPAGCADPTLCGGEVDGLTSSLGTPKTNTNSGVAYIFDLRSLWTDDFGFLPPAVPPKPHQYIVGAASHCGGPAGLIPNIDALRIAGSTSDEIRNIIGIADFNGDGRNDFAVGAPKAGGGQGRLYVAFRRGTSLEGDYVLEKFALDPNDEEGLTGLLVAATAADGFGSSLATGFDFNADGISDIAVGSPNASGGIGEVIVLFGQTGVVSGANGISVQDLLSITRTADGSAVAARITGPQLDVGGQFGFNIANAGDIDGDGFDDLLIAAPNATPRFDPDPTDATDALTEPGVDADFDGLKDDVSGQFGVPDNVVDSFDNLTNAGVVYVIYGSNRLDFIPNIDFTVSVDELGGNQLRGFIVAGRRAGDRIGGGDAGIVADGGISAKQNRGRSFGLSSAGDVDGDGRADILIGSILADPRLDPNTGESLAENGGEAYLIYGSSVP